MSFLAELKRRNVIRVLIAYLVAAGRPDEALEIYERMAEEHKAQGVFEGYEAEWLVTSAMALHDLGRIDEAAERIALLELKQDDYLAYRLAKYSAHVGDKDITLAWITKSPWSHPVCGSVFAGRNS